MLLTLVLSCSKEPTNLENLEPPPPPPAPRVTALTLPVGGQVDVETIKNGSAPVSGSFAGVSGEVTIAGDWSGVDGDVSVDLSSWDSGLELRDDRVKNTFFDLAAHGTATFALATVDGLPDGGPAETGSPVTVTGKLGLNGVEVDTTVQATLTPAGDGYTLATTEAFQVGIAAHGLGDRLQALITECAHESVDDGVAVSLALTLGDVPAPEPAGQGEGEAGEAPAEAPAEDATSGDDAP